MFSVVYVSSASRPFSTEELAALLATSRRNNTRDGITGMLLYRDGNIMQVLEGEEAAVRALFERVRRDPRHHDVTVLLEEHGPRQFAEWSMAFRDLGDATVRALPGFSPYLHTTLGAVEFAGRPSACRDLLAMFRESMR